jgi:hypothetical protein
MTEIKPATDAEIELVRDNVRRGIGIADKFAPGVLACLDAERARAEAAEAKLAKVRKALLIIEAASLVGDARAVARNARAALDDTGGGDAPSASA